MQHLHHDTEDDIRPNEIAKVIKAEPETHYFHSRPPRPPRKKRHKPLPKGIVWGIVGLVVLFVGGTIISFFVLREHVINLVAFDAQSLRTGVANLEAMDPQAAEQDFSSLDTASSSSLGGILGSLKFLFKGGTNAIGALADLSNQLTLLSQESTSLGQDGLAFASSGNGSAVLTDLTSIQTTLSAVTADGNNISSAAQIVGISGGSYLSFEAQLQSTQRFLDAFIPWFSSPTPHHVLVLLQNSSELRSGGGFIGSYADIAMAGGNVTNVSVHDVADVDNAFSEKIVPPVPLQLEVKGLRPADGNWFFDFPTSASETISLFEASKLYSTTTFDAVIAVSPSVVSDLLGVTGPVTVSATGTPSTTFTQSNLLTQTQKIVQAGQASSSASTYPKAILEPLMRAIAAQLASSGTAQRQALGALAERWVSDKDVMIYFPNSTLESFAATYGADGSVYQLPENFNGDYLGLTDTDINSDKSELYVSSTVNFVSQINSDGTVDDQLTIVRKHNGNKSPYWWYQTSNQDYLQVFLPPDAALTNESGGIVKNVPAPVNYAAAGYSTDPMIASIASTTQSIFGYPAVASHEESGKRVFSTWSLVHAGQSATLTFDYTHRLFVAPIDGESYQFIFDKQAGTHRTYNFEIDAPLGFVFAETGISSYTYTSNNPPGRLVIDLTLQKLSQ